MSQVISECKSARELANLAERTNDLKGCRFVVISIKDHETVYDRVEWTRNRTSVALYSGEGEDQIRKYVRENTLIEVLPPPEDEPTGMMWDLQ